MVMVVVVESKRGGGTNINSKLLFNQKEIKREET